MPKSEKLFLNELKMYFQNFYDCKELMRELNIQGGLTKVAKYIGLDRIGTMHQAGSDSHLTSGVFFQLRARLKQVWVNYTEASIQERFNGKIAGVGDSVNDEAYIWEYKQQAKEMQYQDQTGYINLRLKEVQESKGGNGASNQGILRNSSAHGMLPQQPSHHMS